MPLTFRTTISLPQSPNPINYQTPLLLMGSCFAENIGQRLQQLKFPLQINPFGILYNPLSINQALQQLLHKKAFTPSDLHYHHEQWLSLAHHGRFAHSDQSLCLSQINLSLKQGAAQLKKAKWLILTFGTAFVYTWKETGKVVANCHKMPASNFNRKKIKESEMVRSLLPTLQAIKQINPNLQVLCTLSPIRHWKDGAVENQWSKATLLVAIHELIQTESYIHYFPAYEIMMDDLRDYRFYAEDLLHPNATAIQYIWEQFQESYLYEEETQTLLQKIQKMNQARQHRPRNPNSEAHQRFLQKQGQMVQQLQHQYPSLDFSKELRYFSSKEERK